MWARTVFVKVLKDHGLCPHSGKSTHHGNQAEIRTKFGQPLGEAHRYRAAHRPPLTCLQYATSVRLGLLCRHIQEMSMAKLEDIFGVSAKPILSYVERDEVDSRFRDALISDK